MHVVACTQKPLVASIGSITRSNFPVRLVGSVASADDAKIAAGIGGTGAEQLLGRGDFLLVAKGQVTRLQGAYVREAEIRRLVGQLSGGRRHSRRWLGEEEEQLATGTEGRVVKGPGKGRRLGLMFGQQLRLIK